MKKSTEKQITVQTTNGEQLVFIFKYDCNNSQKEQDLLKNILIARMEETK